MQQLVLNEGSIVSISYAELPVGTFIRLEPQSPDFLEISNPKVLFVRFLGGDIDRSLTICMQFGNFPEGIRLSYRRRRDFRGIYAKNLRFTCA